MKLEIHYKAPTAEQCAPVGNKSLLNISISCTSSAALLGCHDMT